ncbi:MAG: polymer-forming cytoskeletal protein [Candidatus Dadabacteria bacterium]|nr:polymer-forming cytoskeletal protein [Candidatus Dadabacteria bacterium]MYC40835.1 polymer-forming cytoskeletal protein [Candidatus Dadabacteria bacterium]
MYGKKQKNGKKNPETVETILGKGAVFEGNISCEGSMKVEGTLKGNVKADHTFVVGPNGSVTGDINAGGVIIFGEVNGKIDAGSLEIKSTGRITGEILIETLITEAGGVMRAKCEMKGPAQQTGSDDQVLTVSYSKQ